MDDPTELYYQYAWIQEPKDSENIKNEVENILTSSVAVIEGIINELKNLQDVKHAVKQPVIRSLNAIKQGLWDNALVSDNIPFKAALKKVHDALQSVKTAFQDNSIPMKTLDNASDMEFMRLLLKRCTRYLKASNGPYRFSNSKDDSFRRSEVGGMANIPASAANQNIITVYNGQMWFTMQLYGNLVHFSSNVSDGKEMNIICEGRRESFPSEFIEAFNTYCQFINRHYAPIPVAHFTAIHNALHWHALDRLATLVALLHSRRTSIH